MVKAAEVLQGCAVAQLVLVLPGRTGGWSGWAVPADTPNKAKGTHTAAGGGGAGTESASASAGQEQRRDPDICSDFLLPLKLPLDHAPLKYSHIRP